MKAQLDALDARLRQALTATAPGMARAGLAVLTALAFFLLMMIMPAANMKKLTCQRKKTLITRKTRKLKVLYSINKWKQAENVCFFYSEQKKINKFYLFLKFAIDNISSQLYILSHPLKTKEQNKKY